MTVYRLFLPVLAVISVVIFSGCTVIRESAPEKSAVTVAPQEYELARQLLQAFVKNDAETFVALLPEETRAKFTAENFANTRRSVIESIGEPVAYSYLTTLELPALHPQIWKVKFRRKNINQTREYTSEVLFKVVTGMDNNKKAVITGFFFL